MTKGPGTVRSPLRPCDGNAADHLLPGPQSRGHGAVTRLPRQRVTCSCRIRGLAVLGQSDLGHRVSVRPTVDLSVQPGDPEGVGDPGKRNQRLRPAQAVSNPQQRGGNEQMDGAFATGRARRTRPALTQSDRTEFHAPVGKSMSEFAARTWFPLIYDAVIVPTNLPRTGG